jgi:hypothetical protein
MCKLADAGHEGAARGKGEGREGKGGAPLLLLFIIPSLCAAVHVQCYRNSHLYKLDAGSNTTSDTHRQNTHSAWHGVGSRCTSVGVFDRRCRMAVEHQIEA